MGGWKKWAGFVIWCVLLFGGMIAAGTDLWPLGPIGSAAVMMVLGAGPVEQAISAVFVCPSCGAELSGQDFRSSKWSLDGSKIMYCHICGAMFPVEECRRKEP